MFYKKGFYINKCSCFFFWYILDFQYTSYKFASTLYSILKNPKTYSRRNIYKLNCERKQNLLTLISRCLDRENVVFLIIMFLTVLLTPVWLLDAVLLMMMMASPEALNRYNRSSESSKNIYTVYIYVIIK